MNNFHIISIIQCPE